MAIGNSRRTQFEVTWVQDEEITFTKRRGREQGIFVSRDRKHDDSKELKHNGDHRNSRHHDDHRSSRRNDEHKSSKRDSDHRSSHRDDHGDRKYNDDRGDLRDSDGEAGGKRNSPQEEIGNRYYGEPDKARENPEDAEADGRSFDFEDRRRVHPTCQIAYASSGDHWQVRSRLSTYCLGSIKEIYSWIHQ